MPDSIKDGTGKGYVAKVDTENRLHTFDTVQSEEVHVAETHGQTFGVSSGSVTLTSLNPHLVLYLTNTSSTRWLYVTEIIVSYNGGTTNHNRACLFELIKSPGAPTVNNTAGTIGNLNFASGETAEGTMEFWDGVGNGMTSAGGAAVLNHIIAQGATSINPMGLPIMNRGGAIGIRFTGEEIGDVCVSMRFMYKEVN